MSTIPMYYSGLSACSFKEFDRSFLPLAIQLQPHSTSVLIVNLILRAVKNLVRSPMNILAGYGLFRLQVALLEQHPNILQIDSRKYKSLSVYDTFPQTISKTPHWAKKQTAVHGTFGPREVFAGPSPSLAACRLPVSAAHGLSSPPAAAAAARWSAGALQGGESKLKLTAGKLCPWHSAHATAADTTTIIWHSDIYVEQSSKRANAYTISRRAPSPSLEQNRCMTSCC